MKSSVIFIILAIISWGLWGFFAKLSAVRIGPQGSFWNALSLITINIVFLLVTGKLTHVTVDAKGISMGILAGLFSGLASVLFYILSVKKPAGILSATIALYPAVTLILAFIFLQERLNLQQVIGIVLALMALIFLSL